MTLRSQIGIYLANLTITYEVVAELPRSNMIAGDRLTIVRIVIAFDKERRRLHEDRLAIAT